MHVGGGLSDVTQGGGFERPAVGVLPREHSRRGEALSRGLTRRTILSEDDVGRSLEAKQEIEDQLKKEEAKLNQPMAANKLEEAKQLLEKAMIEPGGGTPEEFAAFLRADRQRFADIARTANIRMD